MNNFIKAIIFDVGGVLYHPDISPRRMWEEKTRLSERELAEIVFNNPTTRLAKLGKATPDEIWYEVQTRLGLTDSELAQFKIDMWVGNWDFDLLELAKRLKERYKLATMSDAWPDARENIKEYVNYDLFDVILFSAEEGFLKPEPKFFELVAKKLDVLPEECIFVDDSLNNVKGAIAFGMKGIHYTDTNQVQKALLDLSLGKL